MKISVLDLGTNTFHLLILEKYADGTIQELHHEKRFVRLGKGGISQGFIAEDAYQRAFSALNDYMEIIKNHGEMNAIRATATSALRSASNGQEFIDEVKAKIGFDLEIISGDQEAELIFDGVTSDIPLGEDKCLIMDIGGGSVEFIIGSERGIRWKQSFEIGAQRLFDLFYKEDPIPKKSIKELHYYLGEMLHSLKREVKNHQPKILIGSSGTFDTIWDMHIAGRTEAGSRVREINYMGFHQILKPLVSLNQSERLKIAGMIPERVDMIVVASILVDFVFRLVNPNILQLSNSALKEGVAKRLFEELSE
jgi:exopolyphosphatase/guanosine-5'-triphosphate,3'-diphosphate pyrophosphatase